jgi:hypothetical protein
MTSPQPLTGTMKIDLTHLDPYDTIPVLIRQAAGRKMGVYYTTKDGRSRTFNGTVSYENVRDYWAVIYDTNAKGYRTFDFDRVRRMTVNGQTFNLKP